LAFSSRPYENLNSFWRTLWAKRLVRHKQKWNKGKLKKGLTFSQKVPKHKVSGKIFANKLRVQQYKYHKV
jgi:hypothetical protein